LIKDCIIPLDTGGKFDNGDNVDNGGNVDDGGNNDIIEENQIILTYKSEIIDESNSIQGVIIEFSPKVYITDVYNQISV
jgi:hypothetical protein